MHVLEGFEKVFDALDEIIRIIRKSEGKADSAEKIMYQPRKRLDVGTWGVMGIGMGFAVAAAIETGKPVLAVEGDSAFGFSGMA